MPEPSRRIRFRFPFRTRARIRADVEDELRFDIEMRTADLVATGLAEPAARARALADFGDLEATRTYCEESDMQSQRSRQRGEWIAELRQDITLALRGMRRSPVFTCVVVLTLALGIGVGTAVFSVVRTALFGQLPFEDAAALVRFYGRSREHPDGRSMLTASDVADLQASKVFASVAAFGNYQSVTYRSAETADVWNGVQVGPQYFRTLGIHMGLGRPLDERDLAPDATPGIVMTHGLWQRAFGGDSTVVGKTVVLDGKAFVVCGVLRADFVSPNRNPEVFTVLDLDRALRNPVFATHNAIFRAVGRVAPGVTPSRVDAELAAVFQRAAQRTTDITGRAPIAAVPLRDDMLGSVRLILSIIMLSAIVVLCIVSINIAGLYFARSTLTHREVAVRMALGAGRARLVRQLLTESVTMGVLGGAVGLVLAFWVRTVLSKMTSSLTPLSGSGDLDWLNLAFAAAVSVLSALAFGIAPALLATRTQISGVLSQSSRSVSGGRTTTRTLRALVVAQVASAVVLIAGAGLLGRTIVKLEHDGMGFDTDAHVLTFSVAVSRTQYPDAERQSAFFDALTERVRGIPLVTSVGRVVIAPWNGYTAAGPDSVFIEGGANGAAVMASAVTVSDGYFATMGIPIRAGREFAATDRAGQPLSAIVSAEAARRYWPGQSAIGQRLRIGMSTARLLEVVGVAGEVRDWPGNDFLPTVYLAVRQAPTSASTFVVRCNCDASTIAPAIRAQLHALDATVPFVAVRTVREIFDGMLGAQRLPLFFVGAFAALALLLAALGVYGVLAYVVTARTREFGIRKALGAPASSIMRLVLRQSLTMTGPGVLAGMIVALMATRLLDRLLVGITARDPATLVGTVVVILSVSAVASVVPALRAIRTDPVLSLRSE